MEAQRHGKQTRYASFFPPSLPFPFNFDLYFKNSVQSSILYSSPFHSFYSSDLSKIPFDRYHSTTLFLPSFLIYSHFSVIRITLFQIYPDRRPNFSSIFLSLSRISLLQRFLSNHFFFPFFLIPFLYLFLPLFYHFYLLKIPSNDIVFSVSLLFFPFFFFLSLVPRFLSFRSKTLFFFLSSFNHRYRTTFYLYLSFSPFTFIYSNFVLFCTIDRPLKFTFSPTSFFLFLFAASFVGFEGRNRSILPFIQFLSPSPLLPFRFTRSFSFFPFLSPPLSRYRAEQRKKLADRLISGQDTSFFVSSERCVRIVFFSSSSFFSPSLQFTIDSSADTSHPLPSLPCDEHDDYRFIPRRYREAISPLSLDPSWIIFPRDPPCLR